MNEIPAELHIQPQMDWAWPVLLAAIGVALVILALGWLSRRNYLALPELRRGAAGEIPDHVVVIPARDEWDRIAQCVASLEGSLRVVVDDGSKDGTAKAAAAAGAEVRQAPPLPAHWLGKAYACWTGAGVTESDWILFVDADTWYEAGFAASLLGLAAERQLHAATVFPRLHLEGWMERVLVPYELGLQFMGMNAGRVGNPRSLEVLANGQCLLFRRSAYEFVGGHKAVAEAVIEDVALARLLKRHRMNIAVLRGETLAHARMYRSAGELWRGVQKNSLRLLHLNPKAAAWAVASSLVMLAWLPMLGALLWQEHWGPAAAFFFVPALAWRGWYGGWRDALCAPVAIYLFQAIAVSAAVASALGMRPCWKGRRI
ncbi:MAG: glycosyltransferase [Acidobacteria bacterium]|nr:glycosyltransferase [Acidobacteriota bacterium]